MSQIGYPPSSNVLRLLLLLVEAEQLLACPDRLSAVLRGIHALRNALNACSTPPCSSALSSPGSGSGVELHIRPSLIAKAAALVSSATCIQLCLTLDIQVVSICTASTPSERGAGGEGSEGESRSIGSSAARICWAVKKCGSHPQKRLSSQPMAEAKASCSETVSPTAQILCASAAALNSSAATVDASAALCDDVSEDREGSDDEKNRTLGVTQLLVLQRQQSDAAKFLHVPPPAPQSIGETKGTNPPTPPPAIAGGTEGGATAATPMVEVDHGSSALAFPNLMFQLQYKRIRAPFRTLSSSSTGDGAWNMVNGGDGEDFEEEEDSGEESIRDDSSDGGNESQSSDSEMSANECGARNQLGPHDSHSAFCGRNFGDERNSGDLELEHILVVSPVSAVAMDGEEQAAGYEVRCVEGQTSYSQSASHQVVPSSSSHYGLASDIVAGAKRSDEEYHPEPPMDFPFIASTSAATAPAWTLLNGSLEPLPHGAAKPGKGHETMAAPVAMASRRQRPRRPPPRRSSTGVTGGASALDADDTEKALSVSSASSPQPIIAGESVLSPPAGITESAPFDKIDGVAATPFFDPQTVPVVDPTSVHVGSTSAASPIGVTKSQDIGAPAASSVSHSLLPTLVEHGYVRPPRVRGRGAGFSTCYRGSSLTHTLTGLAHGARYCWRVRAYQEGGAVSPWSRQEELSTPPGEECLRQWTSFCLCNATSAEFVPNTTWFSLLPPSFL